MSKKDKELKKLKKGKDKDKKKKKKVRLEEVRMPEGRYNTRERGLVFIDDESMSLEERVYAIPYDEPYNFDQNRIHQLVKEGLYDKYLEQNILTTYCGTVMNHGPYSKGDGGIVSEINDDIREALLSKQYAYVNRRADVEYSPRMNQYVGAVIVESKKYILVLKSIAGRLEGKYTMIQGHVDYDSSFVYLPLESFIAKNAYRELTEEVKLADGTELPVEFMDTEASYIINKAETLVDVEHLGIVYKYKVSDEMIHNIVSAEPEKHEVIVIPKNETHNEENMEKYDSWLSSIMKIFKK